MTLTRMVKGDAAETCFLMERGNGVSFENRTPEEQVIRAEENKNIWRVAKRFYLTKNFDV